MISRAGYPGVHEGCERFFRPNYVAHLVSEWLPALDGVVEKLERGARVADAGCSHGASLILMAQRYPRSSFVGFDNHAASIDRARQRAAAAGVADRVISEAWSAQDSRATNTTLPRASAPDRVAASPIALNQNQRRVRSTTELGDDLRTTIRVGARGDSQTTRLKLRLSGATFDR